MLLNLIKEIEQASGNAKLGIMKSHPELKELMEWTYNPFKKYYMTSSGITLDQKGGLFFCNYNGHISLTAEEVLLGLTNRVISGNQAKEIVSDFISEMDHQSAELFQRVLDKDLKCGVNATTVLKVWPNLFSMVEGGGEKPDVYKCVDFEEKWLKFPLLVAPKLDGVRGRFFNGKMYSRQCKILIGLEHIEVELSKIGDDFDGELMVPGYSFDETSGLIRNQNSTPEAVFHIFDAPGYSGTKKERLDLLEVDIKEMPPGINLIDHRLVTDGLELDIAYQDYLADGYEGLVMYYPDSHYKNGRGHDWMRIVPLKNEDLIIIGTFPGKGKFAGTHGGIIVQYKEHECRVGTGFDDKLRKDLHLYIGKHAQIEFKEKSKTGKMRQPRFKRWRFDK